VNSAAPLRERMRSVTERIRTPSDGARAEYLQRGCQIYLKAYLLSALDAPGQIIFTEWLNVMRPLLSEL
jgi:hypothetical protein